MKEFVCIVCPNSCHLSIDETTKKVTGNKCPRGEKFAINEITNPMRTISSTCKTIFKFAPVVPVRVNKEIPKNKIFDVMKEINKVVIKDNLKRGDVVINNVCKLNVDVIITTDKLNIKEDK